MVSCHLFGHHWMLVQNHCRWSVIQYQRVTNFMSKLTLRDTGYEVAFFLVWASHLLGVLLPFSFSKTIYLATERQVTSENNFLSLEILYSSSTAWQPSCDDWDSYPDGCPPTQHRGESQAWPREEHCFCSASSPRFWRLRPRLKQPL